MASGPERFLAATAHLPITPRRMPDSTHTAAEAAAAVGCEVGAIVKSLVFVAEYKPAAGAATVKQATGSADDVFPASPQQLVEWAGGELARIGVR